MRSGEAHQGCWPMLANTLRPDASDVQPHQQGLLHMYICIHTYDTMHVYTYTQMRMYVSVYIYICVHMHR